MQRIKTTADFIVKANKVHQNRYSYDKSVYVNAKTKILIVCKQHGDFLQNVGDHLFGAGCPRCKADKKACKWDELYQMFQEQHGEYYTYDRSSFTRNSVKMRIICPKHGEFWQKPELHKAGSGCKLCTAAGGPGKYCETIFNRTPSLKTMPGCLYHIELFDIDGTKFYKVGITISMKTRFYKFIEKNNGRVCWVKNDTLYECFLAEQQILLANKHCQYMPKKLTIGGKHECFTHEVILNNDS